MKPSRKRLLIIMLSVAILLVVIGVIAQPLIQQSTTVQQRTDNAILGGIGFILIFIGIIVAFIDSIIFLATILNHNVSESVHGPLLNVFIGGIVLGVIGMFQPFLFVLYQIGFGVLFISLIGFMVWSHIVPRGARRQAEIGSLSASEIENKA
jgi:hypothetical protein